MEWIKIVHTCSREKCKKRMLVHLWFTSVMLATTSEVSPNFGSGGSRLTLSGSLVEWAGRGDPCADEFVW